MKASRRHFLAWTGSSTLALYARTAQGQKLAVRTAAVPTLDPAQVPRFVTPLLVPPVMPRAATLVNQGGKNTDYYEVSVRQFAQQMLPAGFAPTTVWGYGPVAAQRADALLAHHAPSFTIEARHARPVRVKWINQLVDASGAYLPHLLPVDPTLHWANPPGGLAHRDSRPPFSATPASYRGPVPLVTHVHGAVGVGDESDGYAEAWYLPVATNLPADHATVGTWYDFFKNKAQTRLGVTWQSGSAVFEYPNLGRASADWYHDHTLGLTRVNVYAGPAGFYIIRGGPGGDDAVLDARTRLPAAWPGPAPKEGDRYPPNKHYRELALAIQDRAFYADGSLFYPDSRAFFDGIAGPYLPHTDVSPIWNPEFFGNTLIVNGRTWPFVAVRQQRYRLRLLNGCQSRALILDFSGIAGVQVWQVGNEGGFLAAPVDIGTAHRGRVLLGPAERADLIVDFAGVPLGSHVLRNLGPDEPFGGGEPGVDFAPADPATTGQVLQFRVQPALAADITTPPAALLLPPIVPLPAPSRVRRLALLEHMSMWFDGPAEAQLGTVAGDPGAGPGTWTARTWSEAVTEDPALGAVEEWELYNATADAHPMHVHEVAFQVINRQAIVVDEATLSVQLQPGTVRPPEPWETGFKDTVLAYPGEVTRIRARFGRAGQYVWHCHIVEHEDNEMMRPYRVGAMQPGQPMPRAGRH